MKVLVLTTAKSLRPRTVAVWREKLALGDGVELSVVTVHPPRHRLPVKRVDSVEPSRLPFRPVVPVQGPGTASWRGIRRSTARALRLARRARAALPIPPAAKERQFLASACATSPLLKRLADDSDIVVAAGKKAYLGAWHLGRRTKHPMVVAGLENVRVALARAGRELPPLIPPSEQRDQTADLLAPPEHAFPSPPDLASASAALLIAPANYAGQAHAWGHSVNRWTSSTALNMRSGKPLKNPFPTDLDVDDTTFKDLPWRLAWREYVLSTFSHVIVEANRPILGHIQSGLADRHIEELRRAGKKVALLSHGSDARVPSIHAANEPWHSYDALPAKTLNELEVRARHNVKLYNSFDGTVFISTPALSAFIPRATWLPLTIDVDWWHTDELPLSHAGLPVVAHIPSSAQKGSHMIDPILTELDRRGVISYLRVEGVPHAEMPALYRSADLMVEQFGIADYSAAACEAMAAGRVVVSRVSDEGPREEVERATGLELPVVEANPENLATVIQELLTDRDRVLSIGKAGQHFVRTVHDGRFSAEVLEAWMS